MVITALTFGGLYALIELDNLAIALVVTSALVGVYLTAFIAVVGLCDLNGRLSLWRRCVTTLLTAAVLALAFFGMLGCVDELYRPGYTLFSTEPELEAEAAARRTFEPLINVAVVILWACWLFITTALYRQSGRWSRVELLQRVAQYLLIVVVIELPLALMSYQLDTGFMAGFAGVLGIMIGVLVLNFALGGLMLWFAARRVARRHLTR